MTDARWNDGEVVAWTRREGPGPGATGPSRWLTGSIAATLLVTVTGILASDTLCPEHRAWVQGLGAAAIIGSVVAIGLVVRGQAWAPTCALVASLCGIAIGLIDAVHAPARGTLVAVGFGLTAVASAVVAFRLSVLRRWDRDVDAQVAPTSGAHEVAGAPAPVGGATVEADRPSVATEAAPSPSAAAEAPTR
jgi:hypothetical protein